MYHYFLSLYILYDTKGYCQPFFVICYTLYNSFSVLCVYYQYILQAFLVELFLRDLSIKIVILLIRSSRMLIRHGLLKVALDCYFVDQKFKNVNTTWVAESGIKRQKSINQSRMPTLTYTARYLRNKSWKPECVGSFNMDWRILVFYPEPEAGDKIY